jgi:hypothetical protein
MQKKQAEPREVDGRGERAAGGDSERKAVGSKKPKLRGETACDRNSECEGEGKEGFVAEEYPGENPVEEETEAEYRERMRTSRWSQR